MFVNIYEYEMYAGWNKYNTSPPLPFYSCQLSIMDRKVLNTRLLLHTTRIWSQYSDRCSLSLNFGGLVHEEYTTICIVELFLVFTQHK